VPISSIGKSNWIHRTENRYEPREIDFNLVKDEDVSLVSLIVDEIKKLNGEI